MMELIQYKKEKKIFSDFLLPSILGLFIIIFYLINVIYTMPIKLALSFAINGVVIFILSVDGLKRVSLSTNSVHMLFCLLFLWCAPILQFNSKSTFWGIQTNANDFLTTNIFIFIWLICYYTGFRITSSRIWKTKGIEYKSLSVKYVISLLIISAGLALVCFFKFYDYNDRDFSRSSYLLLSNTFRAVITFSTVIVINWQRTSKNSFIFTIIALLILLIGCFPMHLSRNAFGAIYICVLVTLVPWIKKNNRFIVLFTVCFLFMFPVMDLYRHKSFTEVGLREIFNSLITYKDYFNTANYDAYQMIIAAENATDIVGYTYGRQLLGVLLFFIPRNMWVNKPIGTGAYISSIINLEFSNISAPLIAEGYINFGIIGIIGFGLFTGMILRMLDNTYWSNNKENLSFINLIYFYVVPYMLFICRGDLLSAWAYLCAYLFVAYCLYKFALLTGKHQ